jgi:type IV secretion system protein VirB11
MDTGWQYLHHQLTPLRPFLDRADVTDLYVNRPGEVWIETLGGAIERHDAGGLDEATLARLARQVAAWSHQGINREHPILSATLPDGSRVQIIAEPASRESLAIAIRKHVAADLTLDHYAANDAFAALKSQAAHPAPPVRRSAEADVVALLRQAVRDRRNILVSGGTSTGKTTFLNALIQEIPADERLISIEDTPELRIPHRNAVGLLAVRSQLREAAVTADDLVTASLRMRPDRIILGELRGVEAYAFLRAINTGHPGSMTTVHADSAEGAVEQIALLILQGGAKLTRQDVLDYVRASISVYVQLSRKGGRRYVSELIA